MTTKSIRAMVITIIVALAASTTAAVATINAGDRLSVHVYNHPELTTTVLVDSQGAIELPVIGTIYVQGQDSHEVATTIQHKFEAYVPYPAVDVQDISESQSIFVSGGPGGVLPFQPNETLTAAAAELVKSPQYSDSTLPRPNALLDRFDQSRLDLRRVGVYRNGRLFGSFDLIALREAGDPGPVLYANDTISFPNKPVAVRIIGAVNSPGVAYLWTTEPLSDAIVQVGGVAPTAASAHVRITHQRSSSQTVAFGDPIFSLPAQVGDTVTIPTAPRVTVAGTVEHPGVVSLQNDFTLVSALAAAGGYSKWSDLGHVQIVHAGTNQVYNITALTHGDLSQNPTLNDGDTVFVPEGHKTDWNQFFQGLGGLGGLLYGVTHL